MIKVRERDSKLEIQRVREERGRSRSLLRSRRGSLLDRGPGRGGAGESGMAPEGIERESMLG
jgi:hypothetical protein